MAAAKPRKGEEQVELVEKLAAIGCTATEILAVTGIAKQTFYRNCQDALIRGREKLKVSLRRKQYELAINGDKTMLIWLGKQYLSQTDRQTVDANVSGVTFIDIARRMAERDRSTVVDSPPLESIH